MRRILLVLSVALFMVVMAAPSAVGQPEQANIGNAALYCVDGVLNTGPSPQDRGCYPTLDECSEHLGDPWEYDPNSLPGGNFCTGVAVSTFGHPGWTLEVPIRQLVNTGHGLLLDDRAVLAG